VGRFITLVGEGIGFVVRVEPKIYPKASYYIVCLPRPPPTTPPPRPKRHKSSFLNVRAAQIAHLLRVEWGLSKGDRVLLAFNFGLEFFVAFLGCLRAGVVAVPVYPPNPATLKKSTAKLRLVVESCEPKLIVVDAAVNRLRLASKLRAMAGGGSGWPDVPYRCPVVPEEAGAGAGAGAASNPSLLAGWLSAGSGGNGSKARCRSFDEPGIRPEDVAFLQFTSGSTSDPKGVMITFANVDHNTSCIIRCAVKVSGSHEDVDQPLATIAV